MYTAIAAIFVLSVLIFVHELGHFLVAKRSGIRVERFSFGLGPKLAGIQLGETEYAVSWIPFGGYVKMAGGEIALEDEEEEEVPPEERERHFLSKPPIVRLMVVLAGPAMNLVFGVLLFFCVYYLHGLEVIPGTVVGEVRTGGLAESAGLAEGDTIFAVAGKTVSSWSEIGRAIEENLGRPVKLTLKRSTGIVETGLQVPEGAWPAGIDLGMSAFLPPKVGIVRRGGPAHRAGMRAGDLIVRIDDQQIKEWRDLVNIIHSSAGVPLEIEWVRNGVRYINTITPHKDQVANADGSLRDVGVIYIQWTDYERVGAGRAFAESVLVTGRIIKQVVIFIIDLARRRVSTEAVGGPIGIGKMAGDSLRWSFWMLLGFTAFISIDLALINLLPIPVLDGGHILTLSIEAVIRRQLTVRQRLLMQQAGLALLVGLFLIVTVRDVQRLVQ